MSNNKLLTAFLQNLIKDIESDTLSEEKLRRISEFLFSYKFHEALEMTGSSEFEKELENPFRDEELAKYAYLGWYIYTLSKDTA